MEFGFFDGGVLFVAGVGGISGAMHLMDLYGFVVVCCLLYLLCHCTKAGVIMSQAVAQSGSFGGIGGLGFFWCAFIIACCCNALHHDWPRIVCYYGIPCCCHVQ